MTADSKLLSLQKVASFLGVSEDTVRRLVDRGELTAYKVGRQWRFELQAVKAYLAKQQVA